MVGATDSLGNPLSPGFTATPGQTITLSVSGLTPNTTYGVQAHSTPILLGSVTSSAGGTATFVMIVPAGLEAGAHTVQFVGPDGTVVAYMAFTISASADASTATLATTGSDVRMIGGIGGLLLAAGLLMLGAAVSMRSRPRGKHT